MKIAFTSRSAAALWENDLANRRPPMPSSTTTRCGTIAAVYSRCQSQRDLRMRLGQLCKVSRGVVPDIALCRRHCLPPIKSSPVHRISEDGGIVMSIRWLMSMSNDAKKLARTVRAMRPPCPTRKLMSPAA